MQTATITDKISVVPSHHEGDRPRLTLEVPNGWEDVKKICNKVLQFEGRDYVFRGWNSDTLKCFFIQSDNVASFKSK